MNMADIEGLKKDPAVRKWLGKVSDWTGYNYLSRFARFYDWLQENDGGLGGLSPSELLDFQEKQVGRKSYQIADLAMAWANELGGAHNTIKARVTAIRSFFKINHLALPSIDVEEESKPTKPTTTGSLDVKDLKRVIDASNELYRAVILTAFQGGLDASGIEYFSNNGYPSFKEQVDREEKVIVIELPGRKRSRFKSNFYTMINGDAVGAIQHYIKRVRGHVGENEPLFVTEKGTPLNSRAIQAYWRRKIYELGIAEPDAPSCEKCGSKTMRRRIVIDGIRTLVYECRNCGWRIKALKYKADRGHRTGAGLHELRDTFRTIWSKSPAQNWVAEWMMGHKIDKYGYDKAPNDVDFMKKEYLKAAPYLNIMSSDRAFGRADAEEVEALRAEVERMKPIYEWWTNMQMLKAEKRKTLEKQYPRDEYDEIVKEDGEIIYVKKTHRRGVA